MQPHGKQLHRHGGANVLARSVTLYLMEPEGFDDQEKVAGLLFTERELEPLP